MYNSKHSYRLSSANQVPSGSEEFLEEVVMEQRRILINQYVEKFLEEQIESKRRLVTPSIIEPLIDRLVYFGIYHAIIREYYAQVKRQEEELEDRKKFLIQHQKHPDLDEKITNYDAKMLKRYDELTEQQQKRFQELWIPRFKVTKDPREIEIQQLILNLILYIDPENLYFNTTQSGEILF